MSQKTVRWCWVCISTLTETEYADRVARGCGAWCTDDYETKD